MHSSFTLYALQYYINCAVLSHFSRVWIFATPWTIALQAPLSMGFSRKEYWSGMPCPPAGDHPDPGIEPVSPMSPALQKDSLPLSNWGSPHKPICSINKWPEGKSIFFQNSHFFHCPTRSKNWKLVYNPCRMSRSDFYSLIQKYLLTAS